MKIGCMSAWKRRFPLRLTLALEPYSTQTKINSLNLQPVASPEQWTLCDVFHTFTPLSYLSFLPHEVHRLLESEHDTLPVLQL